jgi:hypothetical protein
MEFLQDPIYWLLGALCAATASMPAMIRSIGKTGALAIAAFWLAGCAAVLWRFGLLAGFAAMAGSALLGILLLAASLIRSGIKSMPNQRFEDR